MKFLFINTVVIAQIYYEIVCGLVKSIRCPARLGSGVESQEEYVIWRMLLYQDGNQAL